MSSQCAPCGVCRRSRLGMTGIGSAENFSNCPAKPLQSELPERCSREAEAQRPLRCLGQRRLRRPSLRRCWGRQGHRFAAGHRVIAAAIRCILRFASDLPVRHSGATSDRLPSRSRKADWRGYRKGPIADLYGEPGFNSRSGTPYRSYGPMESIDHAATTEDEGGVAPDADRGRAQHASRRGSRAEALAYRQGRPSLALVRRSILLH